MLKMNGMLAGLMLLTGCGGPLATIRNQAAADLACDDAKLVVEAFGDHGPGGTGPYYVTGCDQLARYSASCNAFGACSVDKGMVVSRDVRRQAAFDLKCGPDEVIVQRISDDTFGASGCSRQASYQIVGCGTTTGCRIVQNTQAQ